MNKEDVLAIFPGRNNTEIRVIRKFYRGSDTIDIRTWFTDPVTGEMKATKKGVLLSTELWVGISGLIYDSAGIDPAAEAVGYIGGPMNEDEAAPYFLIGDSNRI